MTPTAVRSRSSAPRALAAAIAVALGAVLLLATTAPVSAAPVTVGGGRLDWGIKASFRSYVTGPVGGGSIAALDGATTDPDGSFRFPDATGTVDEEVGAFDLSFAGGVRFVAHDGALDLTVDDLRVTRTGTSGALVADVVSRDLDTGELDTFDDITFATLDFTSVAATRDGDETSWTGVPAVLTAVGSEAFADFYPAGTALDPVTVTVDTSVDPPDTTSSTSTTISTTVVPTTTTTAAPSTVEPWGTLTGVGVDGQRLTVSPVQDLDPSGERIRVTGEGYDPELGIYVAFCLDRGPDVPPSPCVGGVDTTGESESATWISDDPPPYGAGLARPFGTGGSFEVDMVVAAAATDDSGATVADCFDPTTRCVVATRADHTSAGDRRADVKVPVAFVGQAPVVADPPVTTVTSAAPLPTTTTRSGAAAAATATATTAGATTLPPTGGTLDLARVGALLLAAGAGLLLVARRCVVR